MAPSIFDTLIHRRIYSIVFVEDYLQIMFDTDACISCISNPEIHQGSVITQKGSPEFYESLVA